MNQSVSPKDILNFWFSEAVKPLWFKKSSDFDREIERRFLATYYRAAAGELNSWRDRALDCLALIIVLDQFPRNIFRDTPRAFATDDLAISSTKHGLNHNYQQDLSLEEQSFFLMPLMHSENKQDQQQCLDLFAGLGKKDNLKFAKKHQVIIDRFGRFPHRNQILGRKSTLEEKEFLTQPGSSF